MLKKILSLLLCCSLVCSLSLTVFADQEETEPADTVVTETLEISSVEEFMVFAESCRLDSYSQNLIVELTADLDLAGADFQGIPIFGGTFLGNGHTISLALTAEGSIQGLFRYLTGTAVVKDLTLQGDIHPQGSKATIGALAGSNAGTIQNCSFSGTLSGSDHVGGLVGINTVTGILEDCRVEGTIHGEHFVGGIAGENLGVIRRCTNAAQINTTPQQNSIKISQITLDTLTNSETASTVTDIGGVTGSSVGVIRGCENFGTVGYRHMGYNIGGIAGSQMGYIVECANHAQIYGRKEVGGIVGQMEPVTNIQFTTDTLQILQGQLDTLGSLTDQATAHAQGSASAVSSQIAGIQDQAQTAKDAVEQLIPSEENPELPDMDSLLAAENALNSSLSGIQGSLSSMAATVQSTANTLSRDMSAISNQVKAMSQTINEAPENLGGTITDISDADTPENTTGKVEGCENNGDVLADLNAGGIAGAIALENDLDPEEDVQISGEESLNFDSELRAVILSCRNQATVTAGKQNAGGIAGWMSMGLAKNCLNTGTLTAESTAYVGGIAGQSTGFIRDCSVNCTILGYDYVGGIAGKAETVSGCRSMTLLTAAERDGAILGFADSRENITGNYYMPVNADIGAIDGVSYDSCAQPLSPEGFLELENLETVFQTTAVTFRFADGTTQTLRVPYGRSIDPADVPQLPEQDGHLAHWEGLTEDPLYFDTICTAVYTPLTAVIQSGTEEGELPLLLAEGAFLPDAAVMLADAPEAPALDREQTLVETFAFTVSESAEPITARYLLSQEVDTNALTIFMQDQKGQWIEVSCHMDGSYLVFPAAAGENRVAIVQEHPIPWMMVGVAAAVIVLVVLFVIVKMRKKKAVPNVPAE